MNAAELLIQTRRPYSSLLREVEISGRLVQSKQLPFDMEEQTQTLWCWAATSTSVSNFYWPASTWTQCRVANAELELTGCCNSSVPEACNVVWWLDRALTRTNNLVSVTGPVPFQRVRDEIDAGRVVGARVGWAGGGGHFMVIYGYSVVAGEEFFDIDDPIYGQSHLSVADFTDAYIGTGSWTDTYFTKSFRRMPIKVLIPIEPILRRIWEVRPLLKLKHDLGFMSAAPRAGGGAALSADDANASLGLAQRVYAVGLDALLTEERPQARPVLLRVYELDANRPRAFFDVSETAQPRVVQMSASRLHLEPFTRALDVVLARPEQPEREAELRLYRVPALNFEALWLSYDDDAEDVLVPLRPAGRLEPYRPVRISEALEALREAARPLAQADQRQGG
jgi:hypothetical protein